MKKSMIVFGVIAISLLIISTATAVPQKDSTTLEEKLDKIQEIIDLNDLRYIIGVILLITGIILFIIGSIGR